MFDTNKNMRDAKVVDMSLSDATKPLLVLSRLVGINSKSRWYKAYALCILASEFLILFWIWTYHFERNYENYYLRIFIHGLEDVCRFTSFLITLGLGLIDQKRFMVPVRAFTDIDARLRSLGACVDNRSTYRFQILLFTCSVLIPLSLCLVNFTVYSRISGDYQEYRINLMSTCHNVIVSIANAIVDSSFVSVLSISRKRFKEINSIIRRAGSQASYIRSDFREIGRCLKYRAHGVNEVPSELKILRREYHNLWTIANQVNGVYGLHLLAATVTTLALITVGLWESYYTFSNLDQNVFWRILLSVTWICFPITRMSILVQAVESTIAEARATLVVLEELEMNGNYDKAMKGEIRDFLMQLQSEVRNFTACGFFDINFKLVSGIIGAACTYLVILIQMGNSNYCSISNENRGNRCEYLTPQQIQELTNTTILYHK